MKKFLSLLMSVIMLLSITAGIDLSAYAETSGNYEYYILDDGSIEITEYNGTDEEVSVPSTIDGYTVTSIGDWAFEYCENLTSITIPDSVTSIGDSAFYDCSSLTSINVNLNNTTYSSEDGVLFNKNKTELIKYPAGNVREKYAIPNSVTKIGLFSFHRCNNLTELTIGNSVKNIDEDAFWGCKRLTKLEIPNGVETIGNWAFGGTSIESITIPKSVNKIGYGIFQQCNNLKTIIVDKSNTDYDSRDNCNAIVKTKDNAIIEACKTTTFPKTVTTIGDGAFGWRATANEITIPKTITRIEAQAFAETENTLKKVTILNEKCYIDNFVYPPNSGGNQRYTFDTTTTIVGYKNSTAHEYAKTHNNPFVAIECAHNYKTTTTKATLSKNGSVVTKCSVCGNVSKNTTIYYPKTITLSATSYTYDGKAKTPSVTVKDSKGNKIAAGNYTVSYASGRKYVGKYAVKITFKGNYSGSKTLYFTINPKATALSSVTAKSKGFTVKWKKQAVQTTGYQIQYSTSSKFTAKTTKTVTVGKNGTTSRTISKLSAKKRYYVRIRTYKTVKFNGKNTNLYSSWSKAKAVTTK